MYEEILVKRVEPILKKDGSKSQQYWNTFSNASVRKALTESADADIDEKIQLWILINAMEEYTPKKSIFTPDAKVNAPQGSGIKVVVLNFDTAIGCVNRLNGICELCGSCYSFRAERNPSACKYHMAQAIWANTHSAEEISMMLELLEADYCRLQENGDITTIEQCQKIFDTAKKSPQVKFWGFTKSPIAIEFFEQVKLNNELPNLQMLDSTCESDILDHFEVVNSDYVEQDGDHMCIGNCFEHNYDCFYRGHKCRKH